MKFLQQVAADIPDLLPPMLVKELWQRLRQKSFAYSFAALHVVIIIILTIACLGKNEVASGSTCANILLAIVTIILVFFQPMRGLGAIHEEISGRTMDVLQLSTLSSRKIVFSKWLAIMAQSLLFVVTLMPYLVMCHFLGGLELSSKLLILTHTIITSLALTGLALLYSSVNLLIMRLGFTLLSVILTITFLISILNDRLLSFISNILQTPQEYTLLIFTALCLYNTYFFILGSAQAIKAQGEDIHALPRIIGLASNVGAAGSMFFAKANIYQLNFYALLMILPAAIFALIDNSRILSRHLEARHHSKFFKLLVAPLLVPGHHSGAVYTCLLAIPWLITFAARADATSTSNNNIFYPLFVVTTLLLPTLPFFLSRTSSQAHTTRYMVFFIASCALAILAYVCDLLISKRIEEPFFSILPHHAILLCLVTVNTNLAHLVLTLAIYSLALGYALFQLTRMFYQLTTKPAAPLTPPGHAHPQ